MIFKWSLLKGYKKVSSSCCRCYYFALFRPVDKNHLEVGIENSTRNSIEGGFIHMFVGARGFEIDTFLEKRPSLRLNILHAYIDLCELEMLCVAEKSLAKHTIERLFISTHSQTIHTEVLKRPQKAGDKIEVTSDFDSETISVEGFVFATAPHIKQTFETNCSLEINIRKTQVNKIIAKLDQIPHLKTTYIHTL